MVNTNELRAARVRIGLNQSDLAKKIGMTPSKLSMKENGKVPFSVKDIDSIAKVLGLSANDIINIFFTNAVALKGKLA
ncbi:MAG: helix-turn-helix transcriptional regulator [Selenomonas sp.]|nr:helix-turn-helix transcriptional regulator [Selenomonas sp.]